MKSAEKCPECGSNRENDHAAFCVVGMVDEAAAERDELLRVVDSFVEEQEALLDDYPPGTLLPPGWARAYRTMKKTATAIRRGRWTPQAIPQDNKAKEK